MKCVRFDAECPWYIELYQVDEFECEDCPIMQEFREYLEMREEVWAMWEKLRRRWPRLYETLEGVTFGLALGSFLLALAVYMAVRA